MRITSGIYRNREIATPGDGTHPMGSRERLALFNMLVTDLPGANVLDAFSGSGALGIEALSRGAKSVTFVDNSSVAVKTIAENLRLIGVPFVFNRENAAHNNSSLQKTADSEIGEVAEIVRADITNFTSEKIFDIILADPPYDAFDPKLIAHLAGFLAKNGFLVLSHPGEAPQLPGLELMKTRKYAAAHITIYKKS